MTVSAYKFTGPLPPPEMLNAYSSQAQAVFLEMWTRIDTSEKTRIVH